MQDIRPAPRFEINRMLCGDQESAHGHRSMYSSEESGCSTRGRSPARFVQDKHRQSKLLAPREPLGGSSGLLTTPGVNSDAIYIVPSQHRQQTRILWIVSAANGGGGCSSQCKASFCRPGSESSHARLHRGCDASAVRPIVTLLGQHRAPYIMT